MKVLVVAPYFYDSCHKEFSNTSSGFGYMVKDIIDAITGEDEIFVFTHQFSKGYFENFTVVRHDVKDVAKTLRIRDLCKGMMDAISCSEGINARLHYLFYQIDKGSFVKTIDSIDPDIIHIHGLTYQTRPFVEACNELNRRYIVTLHGLNGINETIQLPNIEKKYERAALVELNNRSIPVTVVSTGILNKIKTVYRIDTSNVRVIINGTRIHERKPAKKNSDKYEIVCIGSISYRKNQKQLVDSLCEMPIEYKKRIHVSFYGVDSDGIKLDQYISNKNLQEVAEWKGFVPREKMDSIWSTADLNVVMSKEEGFGLSMIEGFMYGVPTGTFSDLDAVGDIYNEEAVELFNSRSCQDVCRGIIRCMERHFERAKIIEWGRHFSMKAIGKQYLELYRDILRGYA